MREDYREQLEKMFPKGFILIHALDNEKDVRMAYLLPPTPTEAAMEIVKVRDLILKTEEKKNDKG